MVRVFCLLRNFTQAAALVLVLAVPVMAHAGPSACNVTVTKSGKNTITSVFVTHVADGDQLTVQYTDMGKARDKRIYHGNTQIGTNVSGVNVVNQNAKKICA